MSRVTTTSDDNRLRIKMHSAALVLYSEWIAVKQAEQMGKGTEGVPVVVQNDGLNSIKSIPPLGLWALPEGIGMSLEREARLPSTCRPIEPLDRCLSTSYWLIEPHAHARGALKPQKVHGELLEQGPGVSPSSLDAFSKLKHVGSRTLLPSSGRKSPVLLWAPACASISAFILGTVDSVLLSTGLGGFEMDTRSKELLESTKGSGVGAGEIALDVLCPSGRTDLGLHDQVGGEGILLSARGAGVTKALEGDVIVVGCGSTPVTEAGRTLAVLTGSTPLLCRGTGVARASISAAMSSNEGRSLITFCL